MTRRWVEVLHRLSFDAPSERCWHDAALRLQGGLSFYLRFGEQVVHGLMQATASTEAARSAATLHAFERLQHYLVAFGARAPFIIEPTTRPMTLLQGARGVVVSQGPGAYLALADEGHPLPSPAWGVGRALELRIPLVAPPMAGLVVALGDGPARAMPAELCDAQGMRRTGELWVSEGAVIFAPTIAVPVAPLTSPREGEASEAPPPADKGWPLPSAPIDHDATTRPQAAIASPPEAASPASAIAARPAPEAAAPPTPPAAPEAASPAPTPPAPTPLKARASTLRSATVPVRILALRWAREDADAGSFVLQLGPAPSGGEPALWSFMRSGSRVGVVTRRSAPPI